MGRGTQVAATDWPRTKSWDISLDCHIWIYRGVIRSKIVFLESVTFQFHARMLSSEIAQSLKVMDIFQTLGSSSLSVTAMCQVSTAIGWPCYRALRISLVMPCPDRVSKNNSLANPSFALSNCVKCDITLASHRSTCPIIVNPSICHSSAHAAIVWQPRGWPVYCLDR